jgi:hypothetical protein
MLLNELEKLESLRGVKPNQNWVSFTKRDLFEKIDEAEISSEMNILSVFSLRRRPVVAAFASFVFVMGIFGIAQNTVPGDLLYSVKKVTEKGQSVLVSRDDKLAFELKLVNERLSELNSIVNENRTGKLASAIEAVNESLVMVSERLKEGQITKEVVKEAEKIEEVKNEIEGVLAARISTEEVNQTFNDYYMFATEGIINDLKERELNSEQVILLDKAVLLYEEGEYISALELLLNI